jgi:hypothetical protein
MTEERRERAWAFVFLIGFALMFVGVLSNWLGLLGVAMVFAAWLRDRRKQRALRARANTPARL